MEIEKRVDNRPTKEIFPNSRDIINYAFTIDGIDYFEFSDFNSVPCIRGFNALSFYEELKMRCTREYLLAFSTAFDDVLNNQNGIKMTDLFKLNVQLKERLELLHEPDIAYKLCSVVFFDATENPYNFDFKHAIIKSQKFKKAPLEQFFFAKPITRLIPYISSWGSDLATYCQMVTEIKKKHIEDISTMLSEANKNSEWFNLLKLQDTLELASEKLES